MPSISAHDDNNLCLTKSNSYGDHFRITHESLAAKLARRSEKLDPLGVIAEQFLEIASSGQDNEHPEIFLCSYLHKIESGVLKELIRLNEGWFATLQQAGKPIPTEFSHFLDGPAATLLWHLELELSPVKSYKMVVLKTLLSLGASPWNINKIAEGFLHFYLARREFLDDYTALGKEKSPERYSLKKVRQHLLKMPLNYLSDKEHMPFQLDASANEFKLKPEYCDVWDQKTFKLLVQDRVDFALAVYWQRKGLDWRSFR